MCAPLFALHHSPHILRDAMYLIPTPKVIRVDAWVLKESSLKKSQNYPFTWILFLQNLYWNQFEDKWFLTVYSEKWAEGTGIKDCPGRWCTTNFGTQLHTERVYGTPRWLSLLVGCVWIFFGHTTYTHLLVPKEKHSMVATSSYQPNCGKENAI